MQMMPEGDNVFNGKQNVLTDDEFAALNLGDALDDEGINPLLWRART